MVMVLEVIDQPVTELLSKWRSGDSRALEALLPAVYFELRKIAHRHLRKERPNHTLQSTDLLHETFLRLMKQSGIAFANRSHFFAIGARSMRQILVDYARQRNSAKRDGGYKLTLDDANVGPRTQDVDIVALDDALRDLAKLDPQQSEVVDLRYFGGLSIEETAEALGVSAATVKREWASARIWLHRAMSAKAPYEG
jgi:RNA polymerase sigma factor (TIGR02999 family)